MNNEKPKDEVPDNKTSKDHEEKRRPWNTPHFRKIDEADLPPGAIVPRKAAAE